MSLCYRIFRLDVLEERLEVQPPIESTVLILRFDQRKEVLLGQVLEFYMLLATRASDFGPGLIQVLIIFALTIFIFAVHSLV